MSKRINLSKVSCYGCGRTLKEADLVTVTENSLALVAHATCKNCSAQSMVTVTPSGVGSVPMKSDLMPGEIKKFLNMNSISYDEILDLHEELKGTDICNLMQQKETSLVKKQKRLDKIEKSQQ